MKGVLAMAGTTALSPRAEGQMLDADPRIKTLERGEGVVLDFKAVGHADIIIDASAAKLLRKVINVTERPVSEYFNQNLRFIVEMPAAGDRRGSVKLKWESPPRSDKRNDGDTNLVLYESNIKPGSIFGHNDHKNVSRSKDSVPPDQANMIKVVAGPSGPLAQNVYVIRRVDGATQVLRANMTAARLNEEVYDPGGDGIRYMMRYVDLTKAGDGTISAKIPEPFRSQYIEEYRAVSRNLQAPDQKQPMLPNLPIGNQTASPAKARSLLD